MASISTRTFYLFPPPPQQSSCSGSPKKKKKTNKQTRKPHNAAEEKDLCLITGLEVGGIFPVLVFRKAGWVYDALGLSERQS
jgi:hypothetical protein